MISKIKSLIKILTLGILFVVLVCINALICVSTASVIYFQLLSHAVNREESLGAAMLVAVAVYGYFLYGVRIRNYIITKLVNQELKNE